MASAPRRQAWSWSPFAETHFPEELFHGLGRKAESLLEIGEMVKGPATAFAHKALHALFRPEQRLLQFLGGGGIEVKGAGLCQWWRIAIPVEDQVGAPLFGLKRWEFEQLKEILGLAELHAPALEANQHIHHVVVATRQLAPVRC